jgi:hypothetical protein
MRTWLSLVLTMSAMALGAGLAFADEDATTLAGAWPGWRGPEGSGSAGMSDVPLVDSIDAEKPLWKSEEKIYTHQHRCVVLRIEAERWRARRGRLESTS